MKTQDFQTLLVQAAVSVMGVDGEIHSSEISAINNVVQDSAYFLDFDIDTILQENINELRSKGKVYVNTFLSTLSSNNLKPKQELILIEVILKIINADDVIAENELQLLHLVKSRLATSEVTFLSHFPQYVNELLDTNNYSSHSSFQIDFIVR